MDIEYWKLKQTGEKKRNTTFVQFLKYVCLVWTFLFFDVIFYLSYISPTLIVNSMRGNNTGVQESLDYIRLSVHLLCYHSVGA